jgi:hypothetical protein
MLERVKSNIFGAAVHHSKVRPLNVCNGAKGDQSALQRMAGYSITSSAMDIKPDGIVMPSAFAVLKLMTN